MIHQNSEAKRLVAWGIQQGLISVQPPAVPSPLEERRKIAAQKRAATIRERYERIQRLAEQYTYSSSFVRQGGAK